MAVRFVLDTDVLIDLIVGREPAGRVIPALLELEVAGTTAITVYDLHSGATQSSHRRALDAFLSTLSEELDRPVKSAKLDRTVEVPVKIFQKAVA